MNPKNLKRLRQILNQFDIKALFDDIFPILAQWVSRQAITTEIQRLKCKTNQHSVLDVYMNLLKDSEVADEIIEEKIPILMILGVACNASRRTWTSYTLLGDTQPDKTDSELQDNLKHFLLENNMHAAVTVKCLDSVHWVQVIEKKLSRNRLKFKAPLYVAHFIGEPYMFLSTKTASDDILESLAHGFGYTGYKFSNLNGHDLVSLLNHLIQKGARRGSAEPLPSFDHFKNTSFGKDFSQSDVRRQFITDLMGPAPPKLSNYVVVAKDLPWKGSMNFPSVSAETFDMKIEFKTNDTVEMLKDMAACGSLKVPPPSYVRNLMSTGKNSIKLRVQGLQGATDTETQTDVN
ncbi:hypothetical protein ONE63_005956 [Megalurothrips usitatus]|uniref:Uncharacterized protein n=1 Tax=Megalurothrips usitatus TaxID=439358 RepID=A0AAV7XRV5_9NEOP|nr:hypothetical protein ONE63_005956 [Megalurothrips usitatus]